MFGYCTFTRLIGLLKLAHMGPSLADPRELGRDSYHRQEPKILAHILTGSFPDFLQKNLLPITTQNTMVEHTSTVGYNKQTSTCPKSGTNEC